MRDDAVDDNASLATVADTNLAVFRDVIASLIVTSGKPHNNDNVGSYDNSTRSVRKKKKDKTQSAEHDKVHVAENEANEMSEFVKYIADEVFGVLKDDLQNISYAATREDEDLASRYTTPLPASIVAEITTTIPPEVSETLATYLSSNPANTDSVQHFLASVLDGYIAAVTAPPPSLTAPRPASNECELCARTHLPLTQHHLVPRQMATKAVKRGWCKDWEVGKYAWLCRACHSFVHGVESNESLARDWNEMEKIRNREDAQKWVDWIGGIRWKKR